MQTSEAAKILRAKFGAGAATAAEARAIIIDAFTRANGVAVHAAELLDVPHRTLLRFMRDPGVAAGVERVRAHAQPTPRRRKGGGAP